MLSFLSDSPFHTISGLRPRGVVLCGFKELSSPRDLALSRMNPPLYLLVSLRRLMFSEFFSAVDNNFLNSALTKILSAGFGDRI